MPGAKLTIVQELPATTVIDGHWGFGFHVNAKAMELTIEKAKKTNVAACTVFRQSHVGRLAAYPLMAARAGMIGIATADSGRSPKAVAPFGGREARLGTNPISIAVPSDLDAPFYLDMATSAVAAGKIALAAARGEKIPMGWVVGSDGKLTTDPKRFPQGRRAAAARRHRGLQGQRASPRWSRCCAACSPALASASSRPAATTTAASWRCSTSRRSGRSPSSRRRSASSRATSRRRRRRKASTGVLYPGEIEHMREQERKKTGIDIEDATWDKLKHLPPSTSSPMSLT